MRSGATRAVAAAAAVAVLGGGYAVLDVLDVVPGVVTLDDRDQATPRDGTRPGATAAPDADEVPDVPAAVPPLPTLSASGSTPTEAGLAAALDPLLADPVLGPSVGLDIRDGLTGTRLYAHEPGVPRTPASTTKLLTAAAVTHAVPGDTRFETRVVGGAAPSDVVLVAGGDTLLAPGRGDRSAVAGHAGLADLAGQTAASLKRSGVTRVRVLLDDTRARGPALAPGWEPVDVAAGLTGPVQMLGTTDTRAWPGHPSPSDPALTTTSVFAGELVKAGIHVAGKPTRVQAPADAPVLGSVTSATRMEVLAHALDESDNALTESIARGAAAEAGQTDLSFAAVAAWVETQLADAGIATGRLTLADTSGLTRTTRAPATTIADVLVLASTGASPQFADVVARLPIAGLDGTLRDRFLETDAASGRGVARAKTGTLTGVHALGGTVVDADGRLLVYVVMADRAGGTTEARAALDRLVARLAACGCR